MCFVDVDGFEDDPELERQYPPPPPPPRPPSLYPHPNVFHLHRIHHHLFLLSNHLHHHYMCFVDVDGFEDDPELERQYPPPPPPPRPPSLYPHHNVFHLHRIHHHLFLLSNHLHTIVSTTSVQF
ncbi:hypothetical protein F2Q68_00033922 [Brassica cretica]|uniref:Uncharacterized protein n=1 Tax=Brassica cretica TaxID=69181 RepID=A0A8S9GZV6_BRACR|nr:hypothetical protein F2Q68_00033922 [Brassica cretica]